MAHAELGLSTQASPSPQKIRTHPALPGSVLKKVLVRFLGCAETGQVVISSLLGGKTFHRRRCRRVFVRCILNFLLPRVLPGALLMPQAMNSSGI